MPFHAKLNHITVCHAMNHFFFYKRCADLMKAFVIAFILQVGLSEDFSIKLFKSVFFFESPILISGRGDADSSNCSFLLGSHVLSCYILSLSKMSRSFKKSLNCETSHKSFKRRDRQSLRFLRYRSGTICHCQNFTKDRSIN